MNSFLPLCDVFLFIFRKKLKPPKRHFKINWPLGGKIWKVFKSCPTQIKIKNKHLTSSLDSITNPESSNFWKVVTLFIIIRCTVNENDNTHFRKLNSGFVDSGFEKLSDKPEQFSNTKRYLITSHCDILWIIVQCYFLYFLEIGIARLFDFWVSERSRLFYPSSLQRPCLRGGTLYCNWFCFVIWGCFSQNDRFVQNWIQGLLGIILGQETSQKLHLLPKSC